MLIIFMTYSMYQQLNSDYNIDKKKFFSNVTFRQSENATRRRSHTNSQIRTEIEDDLCEQFLNRNRGFAFGTNKDIFKSK